MATFLAALLVLAAPARAGDGATCPPGEHPPFKKIRYEEDYSYLSDPAARKGAWAAMKYIPLRPSGGFYLSLGAEARLRYELVNNAGWGRGPQDGDGFFFQRYMLHADLHAGRFFRVFAQLKSSHVTDRNGGPGPNDKDELDVHQAFVDASVPLGPVPGPASGGTGTLTVRIGRHEMGLGVGRLVAIRDRPNVRRSFDGLRAILSAGRWRADGFVVMPVEVDEGVFDDGRIHGTKFWGLYAVTPFQALPGGKADLYYMGIDRGRAAFDQGAAREKRHTFGARLWGKSGPWDYDAELAYQTGSFGKGGISAWSAVFDAGHTFDELPLSPRLGLKAGAASGDDDPDEPGLESFNPLFPRGGFFSQASLIGPVNFADVHPTLDLDLGGGVTLAADWDFFWRESTSDGLYSPGVTLVRSGRASTARYIGSQPTVELSWRVDRHLTLTVNYAHFYAGPFIKQTGPGEDVDFLAAWATVML